MRIYPYEAARHGFYTYPKQPSFKRLTTADRLRAYLVLQDETLWPANTEHTAVYEALGLCADNAERAKTAEGFSRILTAHNYVHGTRGESRN